MTEVLDRAGALYGLPGTIQVDNGSDFAGKELDKWAYRNKVALRFSRPGKPTDNAYIESFNGKFRNECLNTHWFETLEEAPKVIEDWRKEYNIERPHSSLGMKTPAQYLADFRPADAGSPAG